MSLTTNIILWTLSLTLAIFGITFGFIASRNSHKANSSIEKMIESTLITEESQRLFFDSLKSSITDSKRAIRLLKNETTYYDYAIVSSSSRLNPISKRLKEILHETEYADMLKKYLSTKKILDAEFRSLVPDFEILQSSKMVTKTLRAKLSEFHTHSIALATLIIKQYDDIAQTTILKL